MQSQSLIYSWYSSQIRNYLGESKNVKDLLVSAGIFSIIFLICSQKIPSKPIDSSSVKTFAIGACVVAAIISGVFFFFKKNLDSQSKKLQIFFDDCVIKKFLVQIEVIFVALCFAVTTAFTQIFHEAIPSTLILKFTSIGFIVGYFYSYFLLRTYRKKMLKDVKSHDSWNFTSKSQFKNEFKRNSIYLFRLQIGDLIASLILGTFVVFIGYVLLKEKNPQLAFAIIFIRNLILQLPIYSINPERDFFDYIQSRTLKTLPKIFAQAALSALVILLVIPLDLAIFTLMLDSIENWPVYWLLVYIVSVIAGTYLIFLKEALRHNKFRFAVHLLAIFALPIIVLFHIPMFVKVAKR